MCFNQCNNFKFSPLEGEGSCTLPSDADCPMDEEETTEEEEEEGEEL